jgi:hypothetical protein
MGFGLGCWFTDDLDLDLVMDWLILDRALFLFMVGHFMIGSVFADVFSFDALTDTL